MKLARRRVLFWITLAVLVVLSGLMLYLGMKADNDPSLWSVMRWAMWVYGLSAAILAILLLCLLPPPKKRKR